MNDLNEMLFMRVIMPMSSLRTGFSVLLPISGVFLFFFLCSESYLNVAIASAIGTMASPPIEAEAAAGTGASSAETNFFFRQRLFTRCFFYCITTTCIDTFIVANFGVLFSISSQAAAAAVPSFYLPTFLASE